MEVYQIIKLLEKVAIYINIDGFLHGRSIGLYFVGGIHGCGKTVFANKMSQELSINFYSASTLIKSKTKKRAFDYKKVQHISDNQLLLLEAIDEIKESQYILDGHFCLINEKNQIERIPMNVFRKMNVEKMFIIVDKPIVIQQRLKARDNQEWDLKFISSFQQEEIKFAREIAEKFCIPLKIIYENKEISDVSFLKQKNIILPIKPEFAEKILSTEKKYEYRKKLCKKDINKIYIYATVPIKKVIGEAVVIQKLKMNKEELWSQTKSFSGISKEFYDLYFNNQEYACAYQIGEIKRYEEAFTLESIGIKYVPQSFVYCGELN